MHTHPTRTLLILLAALLVVAAVAFALRWSFPAPAQVAEAPTYAGFPPTAPAPTPQDYVTAQKGFQYLVSYGSNGFAPKTLSVNKGETVRFTNNSTAPLQLSLTGAPPLTHGAYFEYTFTTAGTFTVTDGATHTIQVTVK